MWKLAFLVIAAFALPAASRESASAKGVDFTIVIGGGGIAPYYYAIPGPLPLPGQWLGLLPNEGDQPAGRIAEPPGASALLAASYDIYLDELPEQGAPHASYVPAASAHPAYLYWRAARGGMPYEAWFTLTDAAHAYLDKAIETAVAAKTTGGRGLETDWMASAVLHGRCCMREEGTPEFVSESYIVTENIRHASVTITGSDASHLLDAFIATLHHQLPFQDPRLDNSEKAPAHEYTVAAPDGRDLFSFVATEDGTMTRVHVARGVFGDFDPDPTLSSLVTRVIPHPATASDSASAPPSLNGDGSKLMWIVTGALVATLLVAAGVGAARRHKVARSAASNASAKSA